MILMNVCYVKRGANLALIAEDPDLLNGIDVNKLKAYQAQYSKGFKPYMGSESKISSHG